MLGALINCITFIIITIKGFFGYFIFRPPRPAAYKTELIVSEGNQTKEKVLIQKRGKTKVYETVEFSTIKHEFINIPDIDGKFIPAILIRPINCFNLCLIYSHGNSCDIGISFYECCDISLNTNCCVLLYEYPGYGLCRNRKLTEEGIYYNIRKVYDYVKNELNFTNEEIILYGHSLGTGPSIDLAIDEKYPVAALILQAPFLSIMRTVADFNKTPFFDYFANLDKVHKIKTPTLIIHGTKDTIIPLKDSQTLSNLIPREYLYELFPIHDGDHNDIIKNHKSKVYKKLREFLNHVSKTNFSFESSYSNNDNKIKTKPPPGRLENIKLDSNFFEQLKNGDQEINPINMEEFVIKNLVENENIFEMQVVSLRDQVVLNNDEIVIQIIEKRNEEIKNEE